jgi:5-methylcytosine-specific restriction protein B
MAEKTLSVTVKDAELNENLKKFQKLLAYFVWHLEYLNGDFKGEQTFCGNTREIKEGYIKGQGYKNRKFQENIKEWAILENGRVCISINNATNPMTKKGRYSTDDSYLNWAGVAGHVSIYPVWGDKKGNDDRYHIKSLRVENKWENGENQDDNLENISLTNLGIHVETNVNGSSYDSGSPSGAPEIDKFYDAFVKAAELETKAVLEHAKNIIFTGAPGTGKTFLAKQIANLIGAETEFVQFHPSYDYTDFVEGLRPVKDTNDPNKIVFERKDGIFKAFCEKALKQYLLAQNINEDDLNSFINSFIKNNQSNKIDNKYANIQESINLLLKKTDTSTTSTKHDGITPFVFIIDEINRGEISKIFGELFFSVDPGYRGVSGAVKTQYANLQTDPNLFDLVLLALGKIQDGDWGHFFIPENVFIIGTMNDIDRSVESMDFAFRRRFTFKEITAKETQLQILNSMTNGNNIDKLISRMNSLNEAISKSEEFSDAYHIGAAYFKHYEDYANQDKPFDKLWDNHLKGVLFEYLRGRPNAKEILKKWEDAYKENNKKGQKQEEVQEAIAEE